MNFPSENKKSWTRINQKNPCPICKKKDWCCVSSSGDFVLCMRVQSDKPSKGKAGGWLHKLTDDLPKYIPPKPQEPEIKLDCLALWKKWNSETTTADLRLCAESLDVDPLSLAYLGVVWCLDHRAYAFPMRNHKGDIIGFRLRSKEGHKWSVKGSKQGLFYSRKVLSGLTYIVEGASDTAAMLTLGLSVIGRPSCLGQEELLMDTLRHFKIREAVLIPDNDEPGMRGADKLQPFLKIKHCRIVLPTKDCRQFLQLGGTRETIESIVRSTIWERV